MISFLLTFFYFIFGLIVNCLGELVERARLWWRHDLFTGYGRFPWALRVGSLPVAESRPPGADGR